MIIQYKEKHLFKFHRKNDRSVKKTFYQKFLNFLMRKGLKDRYIKFFYKLLRLYKKRILSIYFWRETQFRIELPNKNNILDFSKFTELVLDKIIFELELKFRKFRKKEILIPIPVSPWRGVRLGLNLLLKNTKLRVEKTRRRKTKFLYNLLDELWETQNGLSLTCKNITEFTENVLTHSENFRSTQLFPIKSSKRIVLPKLFKDIHFESKKDDSIKNKIDYFEIPDNTVLLQKNANLYTIPENVYFDSLRTKKLKNYSIKKKTPKTKYNSSLHGYYLNAKSYLKYNRFQKQYRSKFKISLHDKESLKRFYDKKRYKNRRKKKISAKLLNGKLNEEINTTKNISIIENMKKGSVKSKLKLSSSPKLKITLTKSEKNTRFKRKNIIMPRKRKYHTFFFKNYIVQDILLVQEKNPKKNLEKENFKKENLENRKLYQNYKNTFKNMDYENYSNILKKYKIKSLEEFFEKNPKDSGEVINIKKLCVNHLNKGNKVVFYALAQEENFDRYTKALLSSIQNYLKQEEISSLESKIYLMNFKLHNHHSFNLLTCLMNYLIHNYNIFHLRLNMQFFLILKNLFSCYTKKYVFPRYITYINNMKSVICVNNLNKVITLFKLFTQHKIAFTKRYYLEYKLSKISKTLDASREKRIRQFLFFSKLVKLFKKKNPKVLTKLRKVLRSKFKKIKIKLKIKLKKYIKANKNGVIKRKLKERLEVKLKKILENIFKKMLKNAFKKISKKKLLRRNESKEIRTKRRKQERRIALKEELKKRKKQRKDFFRHKFMKTKTFTKRKKRVFLPKHIYIQKKREEARNRRNKPKKRTHFKWSLRKKKYFNRSPIPVCFPKKKPSHKLSLSIKYIRYIRRKRYKEHKTKNNYLDFTNYHDYEKYNFNGNKVRSIAIPTKMEKALILGKKNFAKKVVIKKTNVTKKKINLTFKKNPFNKNALEKLNRYKRFQKYKKKLNSPELNHIKNIFKYNKSILDKAVFFKNLKRKAAGKEINTEQKSKLSFEETLLEYCYSKENITRSEIVEVNEIINLHNKVMQKREDFLQQNNIKVFKDYSEFKTFEYKKKIKKMKAVSPFKLNLETISEVKKEDDFFALLDDKKPKENTDLKKKKNSEKHFIKFKKERYLLKDKNNLEYINQKKRIKEAQNALLKYRDLFNCISSKRGEKDIFSISSKINFYRPIIKKRSNIVAIPNKMIRNKSLNFLKESSVKFNLKYNKKKNHD